MMPEGDNFIRLLTGKSFAPGTVFCSYMFN